jgi:hypothetical protein
VTTGVGGGVGGGVGAGGGESVGADDSLTATVAAAGAGPDAVDFCVAEPPGVVAFGGVSSLFEQANVMLARATNSVIPARARSLW